MTLQSGAGLQIQTCLKTLKAYGANGAIDEILRNIAFFLNYFRQTIVRGIPAEAGQSLPG